MEDHDTQARQLAVMEDLRKYLEERDVHDADLSVWRVRVRKRSHPVFVMDGVTYASKVAVLRLLRPGADASSGRKRPREGGDDRPAAPQPRPARPGKRARRAAPELYYAALAEVERLQAENARLQTEIARLAPPMMEDRAGAMVEDPAREPPPPPPVVVVDREPRPPVAQAPAALPPSPAAPRLVTQAQMDAIADSVVESYRGVAAGTPLRDISNIPPAMIMRAVNLGGIEQWKVPQQGDKSASAAMYARACRVAGRPCAVVVVEKKTNAEGVNDKATDIVGLDNARFLTGERGAWSDLDRVVDDVRAGGVVMVCPAYALGHLVNFVEDNCVRGLHLVLDEADAMFSNLDEDAKTQREKHFDRLLRPANTAGLAVGPDGHRVASLVLLTATNMVNLWWATHYKLSFRMAIADLPEMRRRGHAHEGDLIMVGTVDQPTSAAEARASLYGLTDRAVQRLLDDFESEKPRPDGTPGRQAGKLLLVATCPWVRVAGRATTEAQALWYMAARNADRRTVCLVVSGTGVKKLSHNDAGELYVVNAYAKDLGTAIDRVDREHGLSWRVAVFGYQLVGRSVSVRSDRRVITHEFVMLGKACLVGAMHQTTMRFSGRTVNTREANMGTKSVCLVAPEEDYRVLCQVYEFEELIMRRFAEDPNYVWGAEEFSRAFKDVVGTTRPHAPRGMKLSLRGIKLSARPDVEGPRRVRDRYGDGAASAVDDGPTADEGDRLEGPDTPHGADEDYQHTSFIRLMYGLAVDLKGDAGAVLTRAEMAGHPPLVELLSISNRRVLGYLVHKRWVRRLEQGVFQLTPMGVEAARGAHSA
jgi:hypothetical protein